MLILAMPGIVLATGFFLLLNNTIGLPESADGIVIFTNAPDGDPYALKVLENPMRDIAARYSMPCQSLGIEGLCPAAGGRASRSPAPAGLGARLRLRTVDWRFRRGGAVRQRGVPHPAFLSVPADRRLPQPGRGRHRPAPCCCSVSCCLR